MLSYALSDLASAKVFAVDYCATACLTASRYAASSGDFRLPGFDLLYDALGIDPDAAAWSADAVGAGEDDTVCRSFAWRATAAPHCLLLRLANPDVSRLADDDDGGGNYTVFYRTEPHLPPPAHRRG